jgi:hypothetical protein
MLRSLRTASLFSGTLALGLLLAARSGQALGAGTAPDAMQPRITIEPKYPTDSATVQVRFPGKPPRNATVEATMKMGGSQMGTGPVTLKPTTDPHVFWARVPFGMDGAWIIRVRYSGSKEVDMPVRVGTR